MKNLIAKLVGMYLDILGLIAPSIAAEKGFFLFCRPYRVGNNDKQRAFFNSAEKLKNARCLSLFPTR